jgi:receptor protein-tyrosine kinase
MSGPDVKSQDVKGSDAKGSGKSLVERAAERLGSVGDLSLPPSPVVPRPETPVVVAPAPPPSPSPAPSLGQTKAADPVQAPPPIEPPIFPTVPPPVHGTDLTAASGAASKARDIVTMETLSSAGLVVSGNVRSRISEEYRIAVSRILRAARAKRPGATAGELLMVTSARPGEGKSFTALNLAGAIAHNVMRPTVLVDVDFKKRSITHQLGLSDRMGLLDVAASGTLKIEDLVVPTAIEHLSILPVGRNSEELGDGSRRPVSQVIERLARRFPEHIFILDLPPCLSTSDPSTLAPVVNEIIMVVEAERTQRNEVEAALDLVKLCPKITLLLNKIRTTSSNTFGAYDYYGSYS